MHSQAKFVATFGGFFFTSVYHPTSLKVPCMLQDLYDTFLISIKQQSGLGWWGKRGGECKHEKKIHLRYRDIPGSYSKTDFSVSHWGIFYAQQHWVVKEITGFTK